MCVTAKRSKRLSDADDAADDQILFWIMEERGRGEDDYEDDQIIICVKQMTKHSLLLVQKLAETNLPRDPQNPCKT